MTHKSPHHPQIQVTDFEHHSTWLNRKQQLLRTNEEEDLHPHHCLPSTNKEPVVSKLRTQVNRKAFVYIYTLYINSHTATSEKVIQCFWVITMLSQNNHVFFSPPTCRCRLLAVKLLLRFGVETSQVLKWIDLSICESDGRWTTETADFFERQTVVTLQEYETTLILTLQLRLRDQNRTSENHIILLV